MKKPVFYLILLLSLATTSIHSQSAPSQCGTGIPTMEWEQEMQRLIKQLPAGKQPSGVVYTIPVIIHVIHGGQPVGTYPNLAQGQLISQIQVLNDDFSGNGYNSGNYPGTAFSSYASTQSVNPTNLDVMGRVRIENCSIQFCLATKDSLGNILPEPGIDRISYVAKGWPNPAAQNSYSAFKNLIDGTIKPQTIWNVSKYLNIWVTDENISSVGLLGYATFPAMAGLAGIPSTGSSTTDGFWCYARSFGSVTTYPSGYYTSSNKRGRICTHEIGHWLGIRHIWGDGFCANDYCADTPPASSSNFGAPSYPHKTTSCSGNTPNGEMFMNFMDYVDDDYKYMFTPDQATRMHAAMTNSPYRKFLGTHNLCTVEQFPATSTFKMPIKTCGTVSAVSLTNTSVGTPVPQYTWSSSGPASFNPDANSKVVTVTFLTPGSHTVTLTTDNGTVSSTSKVIQVNPTPNLIITPGSGTVCIDDEVTLTASGGNSYLWLPSGDQGPTYIYTPTIEETFTCIATSSANCTATTEITLAVSECTSIDESKNDLSGFNLYPQPASIALTIEGLHNASMIKISDVTGKLLFQDNLKGNETRKVIEVSNLSPGIYYVEVRSGGNARTLKFIKE
jgi:hypothetical protein